MHGVKRSNFSFTYSVSFNINNVLFFFSSPEHEVLMVSYCDRAVSGVRRPSSTFYLVYALEATVFLRILMKVGQDVCLDEISDEFENGSCGVKN